MLADQLACVHEVAVGLAVLSDGRLVGGRDGVLRSDREWPVAWRVHAARCHRALALGCDDDLDLVLRIFSEWQSSDDPDTWCAAWWVNQQALEVALATASDAIASLSSGMKSDAHRPVLPALGGRARAVINRAMGAVHYVRVEGNRFAASGEDGAEAVELSRTTLVDPGDRVIALNRFRTATDDDGSPGRIIVASTVRVLDWVVTGETGSDGMGLDLLIQASSQLRNPDGSIKAPVDRLRKLRNTFPIGTFVDIVVDKQRGQRSSRSRNRSCFRAFRIPGRANGPRTIRHRGRPAWFSSQTSSPSERLRRRLGSLHESRTCGS